MPASGEAPLGGGTVFSSTIDWPGGEGGAAAVADASSMLLPPDTSSPSTSPVFDATPVCRPDATMPIAPDTALNPAPTPCNRSPRISERGDIGGGDVGDIGEGGVGERQRQDMVRA